MHDVCHVRASQLSLYPPTLSLLPPSLLPFGFLSFFFLFPLPKSPPPLFNFLSLIPCGVNNKSEISKHIPLPNSGWRDHTVPWLWSVSRVLVSESQGSVLRTEK